MHGEGDVGDGCLRAARRIWAKLLLKRSASTSTIPATWHGWRAAEAASAAVRGIGAGELG